LQFGHACPFDSRAASNGGRDWGANAEIALQDCGCPLAIQSRARGSAAMKMRADVNEIE
jgi:hypothetical protein